MAAAIKSMVADRGSRFVLRFRLSTEAGEPVLVEGDDVQFQVLNRAEVDDQVALYETEVAEDGWAIFSVSREGTSDWPAGRLSYRVISDGEFLLIGSLTVRTAADV